MTYARFAALLMLVAVLCCSAALAQMAQPAAAPAPTVSGVLDRAISSVERQFVPLAEAMPAEKFSYAPTQGEFKGVRTFQEQIAHVAFVNYMLAAAILGEKNPVDAPDGEAIVVKDKDEAVKALKDSFVYLHKAVATINEKNLVEPIKSPWGSSTVTRLALATMAASHGMDHYGQCVEYLRANGIVPPASRPR